MTNKELISIANMELRDQLEAERVKVKKMKEVLKECRRYVGTWGFDDKPLLQQIDKVLK